MPLYKILECRIARGSSVRHTHQSLLKILKRDMPDKQEEK